MAKRYSGDVEIDVRLDGRRGRRVRARVEPRYVVLIRSPFVHVKANVLLRSRHAPGSPAAHDAVAREILRVVLKRKPHLPVERGAAGGVVVRRVFQAPCPVQP